jgi:hypothetical protein
MGVVRIDGTAGDNWLKVEYVKRVLGRKLTDEEEAEVLRVGDTAEFFQREKAELERRAR